jgi:choline kinase
MALLGHSSNNSYPCQKVASKDRIPRTASCLENGYKIKVIVTEYKGFGVDTPEDLERARTLLIKNRLIRLLVNSLVRLRLQY